MTNPTPDLESIRKRHEAAVNLARDLQHATLYGPVPVATTMQIASELVWASAEIARLTSALATAKDEERAAIVAETRYRAAEWGSVGVNDDARVLREHADAIESNRHRGQA